MGAIVGSEYRVDEDSKDVSNLFARRAHQILSTFDDLQRDSKNAGKAVGGVTAEQVNGSPEGEDLQARIEKGKLAREVRNSLELKKWLPLSQITSFASILKVLNDSEAFPEAYYSHLASTYEPNDEMAYLLTELFDTRTKKLEHLIRHQNSDPNVSVRELIANGRDASLHLESPNIDVTLDDKTYVVRDYGTGISEEIMFSDLLIAAISHKDSLQTVGRFGVGFFSCLNHINQPGDYVEVRTKHNDKCYALRFEMREEHNGELSFHATELPNTDDSGTSVEVYSSSLDADKIKEQVVQSFQYTSKAKINIKDKRNAEEITVNEKVSDPLFTVDTPYGEISLATFESDSGSRMQILTDGVFVTSSFMPSAHCGNFTLDFPLAIKMPESRDKLAVDKVFVAVMEALINSVFSQDNISDTEKIALANSLHEFLIKHEDLHVKGSRELLPLVKRNLVTNVDLTTLTCIPFGHEALEDFLHLENSVHVNPYFLPPFSIMNLPGVERCPTFDGRKAKSPVSVMIAPFQNNEKAIQRVGNWFFINNNVYEKHKVNPVALNVYFSNLDPMSQQSGETSNCGEVFLGKFVPFINKSKDTQTENTYEVLESYSAKTVTPRIRKAIPKYAKKVVRDLIEPLENNKILTPEHIVNLLIDGLDIRPVQKSVMDVTSEAEIPCIDLGIDTSNLPKHQKLRIDFINSFSEYAKHLESFFACPGIAMLLEIAETAYENPSISFIPPYHYTSGDKHHENPGNEIIAFLSFFENCRQLDDEKQNILDEFVFENKEALSAMNRSQLSAFIGMINKGLHLEAKNFKTLLPILITSQCLDKEMSPASSKLYTRFLFTNGYLELVEKELGEFSAEHQSAFTTHIDIFLGPLYPWKRPQVRFAKKVLLPVFKHHMKSYESDVLWSTLDLISENWSEILKALAKKERRFLPKFTGHDAAQATEVVNFVFDRYEAATKATEIKQENIIPKREYAVKIKLSDLFLTKELNWGTVDELTDITKEKLNYLQALKELVEDTINSKNKEEYIRTIRHIINTQIVNDPWIWLRELAQNSMDALMQCDDTSVDREVKVSSIVSERKGKPPCLTVAFKDGVGMSPFETINYLWMPNESDKTNIAELIGQFGQGFFTLFRSCTEGRVKTSTGNGIVFYSRAVPLNMNGEQLKGDDEVADLELEFDVALEDYRGTLINKDLETQVAELHQERIEHELRRQLGSVQVSRASFVYESDTTEHAQAINGIQYETARLEDFNVNSTLRLDAMEGPTEVTELLTEAVQEISEVEEVIQEAEAEASLIYNESIFVRFNGKGEIEHNDLPVKKLDKGDRELWLQLSPDFIKLIPRNFSIVLPHEVKLTRQRDGVVDYHKVIEALRPQLNTILARYVMSEFQNGNLKLTSLLNYDFFQRYGRKHVGDSIVKDAQALVSENGVADFSPYENNPESLLDLLRQAKLIKYGDEMVSLYDLSRKFISREKIELSELPSSIAGALRKEIDLRRSQERESRGFQSQKLIEFLMDQQRSEGSNKKFKEVVYRKISARELHKQFRKEFPAFLAYDLLRKKILKQMGCEDQVRRYYEFVPSTTLARAHQGNSNGAITHNLYNVQSTGYMWVNSLISAINDSDEDISGIIGQIIETETHERTHQLEETFGDTHNFSFFSRQREIIDEMLRNGSIDIVNILREIQEEVPELAESLLEFDAEKLFIAAKKA